MDGKRLEYLFDCYKHQKCTKEEEELLMSLIAEPGHHEEILKLIDKVIAETGSEMQMPDSVAALVLQNIILTQKDFVPNDKTKKTTLVAWMSVAAAAILIIMFVAYGYVGNSNIAKEKIIIGDTKQQAVEPGTNKAFLTLSDGTTVALDSVKNGTLRKENGTIEKTDSLLIYHRSSLQRTDAHVVYNTLTTPRGGQYQVVLPDGTRVWLNAASSLHFPTVFSDSERNVELTGEAYFEVAKDKKRMFQVSVNGIQIKVLGTHFNVHAYSDEEEIKTSLLEGSVTITKGSSSGLLKPGQQGVLRYKGSGIQITETDTDQVMGWKNGLFRFEGANIQTIMREIGRWYDVEIIYAESLPDRKFDGKISRSMQLPEVLKVLELSHVNFVVEGRRIFVR